ncbi:MAG: hypothetical protein IPI81_09645 [Flavobacteriales bacterium]|nr:hypothetical protein [Flavobacteriales bacterium]MCC6939655.1 hypothetical protein [Flavobacteriales bacterium]
MQTQKYSIQQPLIESLLAWVKEGEIAIPEIQRPFVWDKSKLRDLMDSALYRKCCRCANGTFATHGV